MWRLAGFQWLKPSSGSAFLFFKSDFNLCSAILQAVYSKLSLVQRPANHRLTHRDYFLLLPPPPIRTLGETHNKIASGCRQSCREGKEREVDESGSYGLPAIILPKTKPMMKIPEKASTSVPAQSQRWRRPGSTTESLSCSGFHISGNCGLARPSGFLWPYSSASAGQNFLPLLPWGLEVVPKTFSSPIYFFFYSKPIVVKPRKCLPPKKKTWSLLSDTCGSL